MRPDFRVAHSHGGTRGPCRSRRRASNRVGGPPAWGLRGAHLVALAIRVFLALALITNTEPALEAQQLQPTEAQLKAAFLFNFGRYVTWPTVAGDSFSICVVGRDPFGSALDSIVAGEKLAGKPATVRRVEGAQEASACQIVFISSSEESRLQSTLAALSKSGNALTVSDIPDFVQRGGMIQFVDEGNRVRFLVNLAAAKRAGLALSSELLKVAKVVNQDDGRGAV